MAAEDGTSAFTAEPGFCSECGAILPLPGAAEYVKCRVCSYSESVFVYHGIETYSEHIFNPLTKEKELEEDENRPSAAEPTIDKQCAKCGHGKMFYKTKQMRSADEGQTVFYMCVKCGAKEVDNS